MAAYSEIYLEQYADFSTTINLANEQGDAMNLVGYSASSQLRKSFYATTSTNFVINVTDAAAGELTLIMSSANTANLSPGRYMFDVLIRNNQNINTRVVEGIATILPGVTR